MSYESYTPPRGKSHTSRNILIGMGLLILVLCFGGILVSALSSSEGEENIAPATDPIATKAASPSAKVTQRPDTIREGMWEVGKDIPAGKYRTKGALESIIPLCVWDIKSSKGDMIDFGTLSEPDAQGIVTLKAGQTFTTNGCKDWTKR